MKPYKCPNGLPPDECSHAPQLLRNAVNFMSRVISFLSANDGNQDKLQSGIKTRSDSGTRSRTRG